MTVTTMGPASVMVTGANRGLGLELVKQLAHSSQPPKIIIAACRNPSTASDLHALSSQTEGKVKISLIELDVTNPTSIDAAFEKTESLCPDGLNLLINNAGVFPMKHTPELFNFESMTDCFQGNSVAPLFVGKTFHPLLAKAAASSADPMTTSKAAVVMMSSNLGSIANTQNPMSYPYYAYNASKAALNMVTKCLSLEYQKDGILVSCIHPGWVATDMGGNQAPLTATESVRHMLATIAKMETGRFYNYDFAESGKYLPW